MDIIHFQAIALWTASLGLLVYTFLKPNKDRNRFSVAAGVAGAFIYALLSTLFLGGQFYQALFAQDQMWTGVISLGSIILIAWLTAPRLNWKVLSTFFYTMTGIATVSLLYDFARILQGGRLGGLVVQPNVLAIILGAGLIAGLYTKDPIHLRTRICAASPIILAILLTQTRAVIVMLPIIILPFVMQHCRLGRTWLWALAGLLVLGVLIASPRLTNFDRLVYGMTYRYDLAAYSLQYTKIMPPWGLGPGGLLNVAGDYYEPTTSLKKTFEIDQKIPESSHVILVDRFIEYGWVGGLSYLALICIFFQQAFKKRKDEFIQVLAAIGIFVFLQQLITVPRFHMELIAWVAMLGVIMYRPTNEAYQDA